MTQQVKLLLVMPAYHIISQCPGLSYVSASDPAACQYAWKAMADSPRKSSFECMGKPNGNPGSWSQPGPFLAIVDTGK